MSETQVEKDQFKLNIRKSSTSNDLSCQRILEIISLEDIKCLFKNVSCLAMETNINIEYSIQPYSKETLGFLGSHMRLEITASKAPFLKERTTFFLKTIPYQVPSQANFIQESKVFTKETRFFRDIVPHFNCNYLGDKWGPTCYMIKEDILIFEDLQDKGFRMMQDKMFDLELMTAALTSLAHLHAASIISEEHLKQPMNKIYPEAFEENPFQNTKRRAQWFQAGVDFAQFLAEKLGLNSSRIRAACRQACEAFKPSFMKRNVVSHGDLWGNNFLFNDALPKQCIIVDFQFLRYSPLAHDLTQILYLCATREFREFYESEMIKHYFEVLCRVLKQNNSSVVPSWIELIEGVEEQRLCAIVTAVLFFPTILMDGKDSAHIFNDSDKYDKYEFHDRRETVFSIMQRDVEYEKRIREVIEELVEFSDKLELLPKPI